ncbi:GntR family transcriptional regulator [Leucobacter massiliensis]|uniref:GntR family transcriptional regulator n=1 Tax=Leucobacter massiliensis TaxID=1686285 RepID=A0A2S9QQU7_9MICO|nr:GntR family transcriptional regulator [Leucobacter massiliensis]PRI11959.1 GntR family transcriptional regulator [Leucobacter massiliensis]
MSASSPRRTSLADEMVHRIRTGVWRPGERVPPEKTLLAEFGTSRAAIRQALAELREEGMIVGRRGAPPRVQRTAIPQSFDTFISFSEWAREFGLVPGQRVVEAETRPATEHIARELRVEPGSPVVEVIRLRLLGDQPAMLERSVFPQPLGERLLTSDLSHGSITHALAEAGAAPVRARHLIDAIGAHPLEVEQLGVSPGTPLLRVRRVSFDDTGAVVEAADDRYLPDMASFAVENSAQRRTRFTRQAGNPGTELFGAEREPRPRRP